MARRSELNPPPKKTAIFYNGEWWLRIEPVWVKGLRPTVTYRPLNRYRRR